MGQFLMAIGILVRMMGALEMGVPRADTLGEGQMEGTPGNRGGPV